MWRKLAVEWIRDKTVQSGKPAIVTGHFMFWPEGGKQQPVYTKVDWRLTLTSYIRMLIPKSLHSGEPMISREIVPAIL